MSKAKSKGDAVPNPEADTAAKQPVKSGRRQGSKNVQRDEVDVSLPRCKTCGSTKRTPYGQPIVQIAAGTDVNGDSYTHVVARPTSCKDCGQARRDISYENHPTLSADQLHLKLVKKKR